LNSITPADAHWYDEGVGRNSVEREEILRKLRERIVGFAASHIGGDIAEDLAQEVLILLEEKYSHLDRLEDLLPLSLQIARFKMMSLRRKSLRRGEYTQVSITDIQLPDLESDPEILVERKLLLERLARAAAQLGPRCRQLLRLKLQGLSFGEIQKRMGAQSINTVYTWDHRCRKQLLELMGGDWEPGKK
jgi:RNA polymerase sigma-70 factor, ECF subfamily